MKPFDLEKALAGEPVVTRDGYRVTDIHLFSGAITNWKVIAHIENNSSVYSFTIDGKYSDNDAGSDYDLFMYEPERWVNIYWDEMTEKAYSDGIYKTREEALNNKQVGRLTTIKINP